MLTLALNGESGYMVISGGEYSRETHDIEVLESECADICVLGEGVEQLLEDLARGALGLSPLDELQLFELAFFNESEEVRAQKKCLL